MTLLDSLTDYERSTNTGKPEYLVYTKSNCPQCHGTIRDLSRHGDGFEVRDLESPEWQPQLEQFRESGLLAAPVVVHLPTRRTWTGFRPDLIREARSGTLEHAAAS